MGAQPRRPLLALEAFYIGVQRLVAPLHFLRRSKHPPHSASTLAFSRTRAGAILKTCLGFGWPAEKAPK
eukprot:306394-Amphidinium_carterae.1